MRKVIIVLGLILIISQFIFAIEQEIEYLTSKVIDLGRVVSGSVVNNSIRFVNRGSNPVKIKTVRTSCGCTVPKYDRGETAPGDTATIVFEFNSKGYNNVVRKYITVYFSDESISSKRFAIQANIYKLLEISPTAIDFMHAKLNPDTVLTQFIKLQNNSDDSIRIKEVDVNSDLVHVVLRSVVIPKGKEDSIRVELRPKRIERKWIYVRINVAFKKRPTVSVPVHYEIVE